MASNKVDRDIKYDASCCSSDNGVKKEPKIDYKVCTHISKTNQIRIYVIMY